MPSDTAPNKPTYSAVNSFSRRPCFTQICSYIIISLQAVIFYVMVRPYLG